MLISILALSTFIIITLLLMCSNSILIRNPKLDSPHYIEGVDPRTMFCACGHCEDCKAKKRQAIYTRLYYEFQDALSNGGYCINLTLTYNNNCLPHVSIDGTDYSCFRVSDVQKYIKRVRKFHSDYNNEIYFTYFVSMELGSITHRPHYHVLFFVKQKGTNMCQFIRIARQKWTFGFTSVGSLGAMVKNPRMLNYAAKYVSKDVFEDEWYLPLISKLKKKYCNNSELYNYYKRCLSGRFLCSRGLGLYALSANKAELLNKQLITLPGPNGVDNVPLPQYLDRKRHYMVLYRDRVSGLMSPVRRNKDDVPTYVLNDLGMRLCQTRFKTKLEFLTNRLKEFINSFYTNDFLENCCFSICSRSISEVRNLFRGYDLSRIAAYQILYLHRRDYGAAYDDCVHVTSEDMMCDYMTLCNSSVHYDIGELGAKGSLSGLYSAPYSRDLNVRVYRSHASYMNRELYLFNANIFSFITFYLSQCNKRNYELKVTANRSYSYRKGLALSLSR